MSLEVKPFLIFIVFYASIRNHGKFLLFAYFLVKVVVIDQERTSDKGVKGRAVTEYIIFLVFYGDLCRETAARLFEAEFFCASNFFTIDVSHVLFEQFGRRYTLEIV